jgi:hypothetical protein
MTEPHVELLSQKGLGPQPLLFCASICKSKRRYRSVRLRPTKGQFCLLAFRSVYKLKTDVLLMYLVSQKKINQIILCIHYGIEFLQLVTQIAFKLAELYRFQSDG